MRFIFLTLAFLFFAPLAHANEAATTINKGFTDDYRYSQGRMNALRPTYDDNNSDDGPVLGRKERERFKDAYTPKVGPTAECEYLNSCEGDGKKYGRSDGELTDAQTGGRLNEFVDRKHVYWKVKRPYNPSGLGFLSPCQAQVQDEINAHTGENDEIIFTGNPRSGLAFDRFGNRYSFSCAGGNISIW